MSMTSRAGSVSLHGRKRKASKSISKRRYYGLRRMSFPLMRAVNAGFPDKVRTTLFYSDYKALDSGTTTVATDVWAMNGLYDPYVAAGGHQPLGFDNFMAAYNYYECIKCKVTVTCVNGSDADHFIFGIVVGDTAVSPSTKCLTLTELGRNVVFTHVNNTTYTWPMPSVSITRYIAKELGVKVGDDTVQGASGSNPSRILGATVFTGGIDGADNSAKGFHVRLEYDVVFKNPRMNLTEN